MEARVTGEWILCKQAIRCCSRSLLTALCARGTPGEEGQDYGYKFTNARRRSNSSSHGHAISDFKTKFETVESEPMFEEGFHGPQQGDLDDEHLGLEKAESADSTSSASVEEEEHAKKA